MVHASILNKELIEIEQGKQLKVRRSIMKVGIGIDTGGTCTDAVIYQFEENRILAYAKTPTTKGDLSIGIGKAIDNLPKELLNEVEMISLSTTLATNACVENKGGRAKLIFFGLPQDHMKEVKNKQGLIDSSELIFVESETNCSGEIVKEPDWEYFEAEVLNSLKGCDAVAVVELFANKTGAILEKKAAHIIKEHLALPVVCGHELFTEYNIIKRGASALLNAKLIPIIREFIQAVKAAMAKRDLQVPIAIVRSDGSLMSEQAALEYPIDTILCGPVSSLLGALELSKATTGMIVDMGGTTTDIAYVKDQTPKQVTTGVQIGKWHTFVKGLFVDTFGLGGDTEVIINKSNQLELQERKAYPLCMGASSYPLLLEYLREEDEKESSEIKAFPDIYLGLKDIAMQDKYSTFEKKVAQALLGKPMSLTSLQGQIDEKVTKTSLKRLIEEGVLIRCGITPTDVMHIKGDFNQYNEEAAKHGISIMAKCLKTTSASVGEQIYELVIHKLYRNIVRNLIEDHYDYQLDEQRDAFVYKMIDEAYRAAKEGRKEEVINFASCYALIGVGAPTHIFLERVGQYLNCEVMTSTYAKVANALGAIVSHVSVTAMIEVDYQEATGKYVIFGCGQRETCSEYEEAKEIATQLATNKATQKAILRGCSSEVEVTIKAKRNVVQTDYGEVFLNYTVEAIATGHMEINKL